MARSSFISHTVNGYSRYDVPESKAFTCTPGILYPVRIDFINARDRVTIAQGIDVRSNPLAVPSFNPYTVRLHRFWVPLQLYHPEMRVNSSKFDMNNLSLNYIPCALTEGPTFAESDSLGLTHAYSNSLMSWLRVVSGYFACAADESLVSQSTSSSNGLALTAAQLNAPQYWCNSDTYLAYWDIVRNYYSYSQWSLYSYAWPCTWKLSRNVTGNSFSFDFNGTAQFFTQCWGNLQYLDAFYESQFYPNSVGTVGQSTFNRSNLFNQIISSDLARVSTNPKDGYPVQSAVVNDTPYASASTSGPRKQFSTSGDSSAQVSSLGVFLIAHPMAVVPSSPDRYSRVLPVESYDDAVSFSGLDTIPQLAIASRLQEYKDLLGAGGSRYSDWLETFFASKIEHVDRPQLLFSASQTVNVQVVMNQAGYNNFNDPSGAGSQSPLGQQGGSICFNSKLGRRQSYYFREPGYMIDMLSIRPVYYWAGIRPDYLNYTGADYFNPIYNDIGYQDIPAFRFGTNGASSNSTAVFKEPCFNEFRASYDEVLGQLSYYSSFASSVSSVVSSYYNYWVQQRVNPAYFTTELVPPSIDSDGSAVGLPTVYPFLFVDMRQVNSPFVSNVEDNFFVNLSYAVSKKNLVNKTFATRLSNR